MELWNRTMRFIHLSILILCCASSLAAGDRIVVAADGSGEFEHGKAVEPVGAGATAVL